MKKTRSLSIALILCMILTAFAPVNVYASIGHSTKTIDKSKTITGKKHTIKVKHYFTYVIVDEEDTAVKNINKKLKAETKGFSDKSLAIENAEEMIDYIDYDDEFEDYTEQEVEFMSDKYISVVQTSGWYSGGVGNYFIKGLNFDLSTGKRINKITYFTKEKSLKKIKKAIKKQALEEDEYLLKSDVNAALKGKKAKDFLFFINTDGDVVVCFEPYEMGYGGWTRMYTLPGDVK